MQGFTNKLVKVMKEVVSMFPLTNKYLFQNLVGSFLLLLLFCVFFFFNSYNYQDLNLKHLFLGVRGQDELKVYSTRCSRMHGHQSTYEQTPSAQAKGWPCQGTTERSVVVANCWLQIASLDSILLSHRTIHQRVEGLVETDCPRLTKASHSRKGVFLDSILTLC